VPTDGQNIFGSQFLWLLTFSSLPQQLLKGKKSSFCYCKQSQKAKVLAYQVFVNQQQHQFGRGKKRIWTASCLVQIKLPEHFWREAEGEGGRQGGKEGGREEEESLLTNFATVIQIQTLDKHIHPIMLRLFVDYRHFFSFFSFSNLRNFISSKFYLRVLLRKIIEDLHFVFKLLFHSDTKFKFTKQISSAMEMVFAWIRMLETKLGTVGSKE